MQNQHKFMVNLRNSLDLLELFPGVPLLKCGKYEFNVQVMAFSEVVETDLLVTANDHGFTCRFTDLSSDEQREHIVRCDSTESARDFAEKIRAELCTMHTQLHDAVKS